MADNAAQRGAGGRITEAEMREFNRGFEALSALDPQRTPHRFPFPEEEIEYRVTYQRRDRDLSDLLLASTLTLADVASGRAASLLFRKYDDADISVPPPSVPDVAGIGPLDGGTDGAGAPPGRGPDGAGASTGTRLYARRPRENSSSASYPVRGISWEPPSCKILQWLASLFSSESEMLAFYGLALSGEMDTPDMRRTDPVIPTPIKKTLGIFSRVTGLDKVRYASKAVVGNCIHRLLEFHRLTAVSPGFRGLMSPQVIQTI